MAILKVGNNACFIKARSSGGRLVTSSGNRLTGAQGGSSFGFSVSPRDYILKAGSSQYSYEHLHAAAPLLEYPLEDPAVD